MSKRRKNRGVTEFPDEITTVGEKPGAFQRQPLPLPLPEWYDPEEITMKIDLSRLLREAEEQSSITDTEVVIDVEDSTEKKVAA